MRVVIITVYNSYNCGSALQAKILCEMVRMLGHKPVLLNTHSRNLFKSIKGAACVNFKRLKIKTALQCLFTGIDLKLFVNEKCIEKKALKDDDVFILGSDEIWNVSRQEIAKYPILWGRGLNKDRTISYAPSINNCDESMFQALNISNEIMELRAISVRDVYSLNTIKKITHRNDIKLVCDPTMFFNREWYENIITEKNHPQDEYILLYGDTKYFSRSLYNEIHSFASHKKLKVYAYMENVSIADKTIYAGPKTFLSMVKNATYIVGSSFHITVFSIIFHKNFICVCEGNTKVTDFLEELGLGDRIYHKNKNTVEKTLCESSINYDLVEEKLRILIKESKEFLSKELSSIENIR